MAVYPEGLTMRTVTGSVGGNPTGTAAVQFRCPVWLIGPTDDMVYSRLTVNAVVDAAGDFTLPLPVCDDPQWKPLDWSWEVFISYGGQYTRGRMPLSVSDPATVDLADKLVLDEVPPTGMVDYLDLSDIGSRVAGLVAGKVPASQLPDAAEAGVVSVNGETGVVVLSAADVGAAAASALADYATVVYTDAEIVEAKAAVQFTANAAYDVATAAQTTANAALPKLAGEVVDSTLQVRKGDNSSGLRFRATGGAVDVDKMNGDVVWSSWSGPGYTGTQLGLLRMRNDGLTLSGVIEIGANVYGSAQKLDGAAGVAYLGAKNGLVNIPLTGYKATAGAPTTDTWALNDVVLAADGIYQCTAAGTPGTWTNLTVTATQMTAKANLAGTPTFTGVPAAPTAAAGTNTTQLATTAFVTTADNLKANLASPTLTGTPAAPTAAAATSTTQIATTAFVQGKVPVVTNLVTPGTTNYVDPGATCKYLDVTIIAPGGGGGAGRRGAAATIRGAGAGGGSGGFAHVTIPYSALTFPVSMTLGTAGVGAAAQTTNDTDGAAGTGGTGANFGTYLRCGTSGGGGGGTVGAAAGGFSSVGQTYGQNGAGSSATGGVPGSPSSYPAGASAGGAGGGITSADVASAGGTGGAGMNPAVAAAGVVGGATPGAGANQPTNSALPGNGAGGGAASITAAAQAGAAGGLYGGGGGGGGASLNGFASGAGGNGANGIIQVIAVF